MTKVKGYFQDILERAKEVTNLRFSRSLIGRVKENAFKEKTFKGNTLPRTQESFNT